MRLSGDIEVARLLYDRDIELTDFLPRLNRALAEAPRPPSARRVELDLHVVAPGELYVENNVARIEARADLRVTGTAAAPACSTAASKSLDGTVDLPRPHLRAAGRRRSISAPISASRRR